MRPVSVRRPSGKTTMDMPLWSFFLAAAMVSRRPWVEWVSTMMWPAMWQAVPIMGILVMPLRIIHLKL